MGWSLGKLVQNIGDGIGDVVNNPVKAVKDGLNDRGTLTGLAALAGGYAAMPYLTGAGAAAGIPAAGSFVPGIDAMGMGASAAGIPAAGSSSLLGAAGNYLSSAGGLQTLGNLAGTLYGADAPRGGGNSRSSPAISSAFNECANAPAFSRNLSRFPVLGIAITPSFAMKMLAVASSATLPSMSASRQLSKLRVRASRMARALLG